MQNILNSSIAPGATVECDVCWGAGENGIATIFKEANPDAVVKGYPNKAGIPFFNFGFRAIAWPWQEPQTEIPNGPKEL